MTKPDRGDGRDRNGRFVNRPGPGRPRRITEQTYVRIAAKTVTPELWEQIVAQAAAQALGGDKDARRWLSELVVGKDPPKLSDLEAQEAAGVDPVLDKAVNLLAASEADEVIHAAEVRRIRQRIEQGEADPDADVADDDVDDDIPPDGSESSEN
ncbi:MAG: hypothetical protein GYA33_16350 [Thermogutta sp.]|nr:hypothetical protein [Thermogutta sp.]